MWCQFDFWNKILASLQTWKSKFEFCYIFCRIILSGNISKSVSKNCNNSDIPLIYSGGLEFSSYKIELRNQVTRNDVTFWVVNSKGFTETLLSSYYLDVVKH